MLNSKNFEQMETNLHYGMVPIWQGSKDMEKGMTRQPMVV